MTPLRVAIRVPVGRPLPDIATFAARCEDAGFDGIGIHDHPSSGRDAYLALALAAAATNRLRLFPATSSPVVSVSSTIWRIQTMVERRAASSAPRFAS